MQRQRWPVTLSIIGILMLSGCTSIDPMSLLPTSERVFLEMTAGSQTNARPITVEELLTRASSDGEATTDQDSQPPPRPEAANLQFAAAQNLVTVALEPRQEESLGPIREFVTEEPSATILIEVPTGSFRSRIAAFRRAAAVARYLKIAEGRVHVRPATDVDADSLRVSLETGT